MPSNTGYPAFFVGQRLTASLLTSAQPMQAWKTTSTTRISTATNTADPDLTLPLEANALYKLEYMLLYSTNATADFKWQWSVPSGTTGNHVISAIQVGGAGTAQTEDLAIAYTLAANAGAGGLGSSSPFSVLGRGWVDTAATAGNMTLTWSQFTLTAVNTTLEANSWMELKRVE